MGASLAQTEKARDPEEEMGLLAEVVHGPETMRAQIEERIGEEAIAAGELRQGKELSVASMITGTAVISLLRPRQFKLKGIGVGDEMDEYGVIVRGDEQGSWPRDQVWIEGSPDARMPDVGTLVVGGERFPVIRLNVRADRETDELIEVLSR
jgi:hypothetical protein